MFTVTKVVLRERDGNGFTSGPGTKSDLALLISFSQLSSLQPAAFALHFA